MLDKVIMLPFSIFLILMFVFMGITGIAMFGQWLEVQNLAQHVAMSMGKWGGYTVQADNSIDEFASKINCPRSRIRVEVSNAYPVPWGQPVWARITVPFEFRVGEIYVGTYELTGVGRSVSSYLQGAYNVTYTYP